MTNILLRVAAVWLGLSFTAHGNTPQVIAQQVLDQLYATNGNYTFKKPNLVLSKENRKVAAYTPWKNTIVLDEKAYAICQSFGRDSLAALAYILGHELVHAYQTEIRKGNVRTSFLAYSRNYNSDIRVEKAADIQGIFNAQLAGYPVIRVMPRVIERIYEIYGLMGQTPPGYPTLAERKASSDEVLAIAEELVDVFEAANYLSVIGRYSLAASAYEYILQYYQGVEVYNNLGLSYVLGAQEFWNPQTDNFIYPLEVDWYSKIARSVSRGAEAFDPTLEPMRLALLENATAQFEKVTKLAPNYWPARINMVCALNMMGKSVEALKYAELNLTGKKQRRRQISEQERERADLALGITYALYPGGLRKAEAAAIFRQVAQSGYVVNALYGQQNLQYLQGAISDRVLTELPLPEAFRQMIGQMALERTANLERKPLDEHNGLFFAKKRSVSSSTFVLSNEQGNLVSLLRFRNRSAAEASILPPEESLSASAYRNLVASKDGFYLCAPKDKAVVKVDAKGRVLEMVKYVEH